MFPECINKKQSRKNLHEHTWASSRYNSHGTHHPREDDTVTPICPFSPPLPLPLYSRLLPRPPAPSFPPSHQTDGGVSGFPPKHKPGRSYQAHLHVLEWGVVCLGHRGFSADPAVWSVWTERSRVGERWQGKKLCAAFLWLQPLDTPFLLCLLKLIKIKRLKGTVHSKNKTLSLFTQPAVLL